MTPSSSAAGASTARVSSIRAALLLRFILLIVFTFAVFALGLYFLIVKPAAHEIASGEMLRAAEQVNSRVNALVGQIDRVLLTAHDHGASGEYGLDDVSGFNRLFMPALRNDDSISAVILADDKGRALHLVKLPKGAWQNRLTDVERWGGRQKWLSLDDTGTPVAENWQESGFNPLQRPWHIGAMAMQRERAVYWSDPYIFFSPQIPGITASVKWRAQPSGPTFVIAFDVKLVDLSSFVTTLKIGRQGRTALLTDDGKLVGVTTPETRGGEDVSRFVLKTPRDAGFPVIAHALEQWEAAKRPYDQARQFGAAGEDWLARFQSARFGNGHFIIATMAPEGDFLPAALRRASGLFLLLLAGVIAVGVVSAAVVARSFGAPLESLAAASRRLGEMKLDEPVTTRSSLREVAVLVDAQERMRVALRESMAALEASNRELEARVEARTRELREAREVAEEATRAKSMFLASMSHEIRTPMNGVLGMLEVLSLSGVDPSQRSVLELARESARSLLRIIDDILDFSKIEAGKLELHPEPTSIARVVDAVHGIYEGIASAKDLVLRKSVDAAISPALMVDSLRLRQILNNFVSNGIKFTPAGNVEIRVRRVERSGDSERLQFVVTDTGIGVAREARDRLFQPFVQAEGDTTKRFGGSGLGLTICRRLAEIMGGTIEMESEPGWGTRMTFTVSLRVADPRDLPKAESQSDAAMLSARRKAPTVEEASAEGTLVLLVDDHPTNRILLLRQLNLLGYAAESAENGREALERWHTGVFAAVITDCNMPEMDGYELTRHIRGMESRSGKRRTPVIACTANALTGDAEVCLKAGMDDFVPKPVGLDELARVMDRWLPLGTGGTGAPESRAPG